MGQNHDHEGHASETLSPAMRAEIKAVHGGHVVEIMPDLLRPYLKEDLLFQFKNAAARDDAALALRETVEVQTGGLRLTPVTLYDMLDTLEMNEGSGMVFLPHLSNIVAPEGKTPERISLLFNHMSMTRDADSIAEKFIFIDKYQERYQDVKGLPMKLAMTSGDFQKFINSHEGAHLTDHVDFDNSALKGEELILDLHRGEVYGDTYASLRMAADGRVDALQTIADLRATYALRTGPALAAGPNPDSVRQHAGILYQTAPAIDDVVTLSGMERGGNKAMIEKFLNDRSIDGANGAALAAKIANPEQGLTSLSHKEFQTIAEGITKTCAISNPLTLRVMATYMKHGTLDSARQAFEDESAMSLDEMPEQKKALEDMIARGQAGMRDLWPGLAAEQAPDSAPRQPGSAPQQQPVLTR